MGGGIIDGGKWQANQLGILFHARARPPGMSRRLVIQTPTDPLLSAYDMN